MKREWKEFIKSLGKPLEFLHCNELKNKYDVSYISLPAVFLKINGKLKLIIESNLINACHNISDLKQLINRKVHTE